MTSFCIGAALAASVLSGCTPLPAGQGRGGHEHGNHESRQPGTPAVTDQASPGCDAQFVTAMIPHHQQAIEISALAPDRAADQRIVELASAVTRGQLTEVSLMSDWLRDAGVPVPGEHDGEQEQPHAHHMPGMLTPNQVTALSSAHGPSFDEMFLNAMIRHHQGALTMAEQVLQAGTSPAVRNLAADMAVEQRYEIVGMRGMQIELETGQKPSAEELSRLMLMEQSDGPLPSQTTNCG
jgi:uncharacterized protein (DUF305 family)